MRKSVTIVSAGFCEGQNRSPGVRTAPEVMEYCGLSRTIESLGWAITDKKLVTLKTDAVGMAVPDGKNGSGSPAGASIRNSVTVGAMSEAIHQSVLEAAAALKHEFVLTVGGDHSVAFGSISGIRQARPNTLVVWVDAHGDINVPSTSPSGNYHGMPAAHLLGLFDKVPPGFEWVPKALESMECPESMRGCIPSDLKSKGNRPKGAASFLKPEDLVYIGLRSLDAGEVEFLRKYNIKYADMDTIQQHGIAPVVSNLGIYSGSRPIHLSLDIDSVDPMFAPGTNTRSPGGLTYREIHWLCRALAKTNRLSSMDIVEVNPADDFFNTKLTRIPSSFVTCEGQKAVVDYKKLDEQWASCYKNLDFPTIKGPMTVQLAIELVASALGRKLVD